MITQKLYRNGNSVAVTIPKQYLKDLNLRDGSDVVVEQDGDKVVIARAMKVDSQQVDVKFAQMVDEFIAEHQDVLAELSKR